MTAKETIAALDAAAENKAVADNLPATTHITTWVDSRGYEQLQIATPRVAAHGWLYIKDSDWTHAIQRHWRSSVSVGEIVGPLVRETHALLGLDGGFLMATAVDAVVFAHCEAEAEKLTRERFGLYLGEYLKRVFSGELTEGEGLRKEGRYTILS